MLRSLCSGQLSILASLPYPDFFSPHKKHHLYALQLSGNKNHTDLTDCPLYTRAGEHPPITGYDWQTKP